MLGTYTRVHYSNMLLLLMCCHGDRERTWLTPHRDKARQTSNSWEWLTGGTAVTVTEPPYNKYHPQYNEEHLAILQCIGNGERTRLDSLGNVHIVELTVSQISRADR